jgi:23S rRNA (adenine2503-C2)-methyltransferase
VSRYDVTREELTQLLHGEPNYRVDQVWRGLYENAAAINEMTSLPKGLRSALETQLPLALEEVKVSVSDNGETTKFLWKLADGQLIETVLMHYHDRTTVCVSTQAGCAMACGFCATGQAGFARHLSIGEIVEQVIRASQATDNRVSNVVFMGMGEPFANYDRVWGAIERLHGAVGISARHLTVSTVGIVPGIRRFTKESLPVNLAVSLHAANDELRDQLVPINRRYPIDELISACRDYFSVKRRRVSFEWALIEGVNDRITDARELSVLAREVGAHVNLIQLNPTPGYATRGSSRATVSIFRDQLIASGVNATIRRNRGTDIDAACGQLRASAVATPVTLTVAPPREVTP